MAFGIVRIPQLEMADIIDQLSALDTPVVDRAVCERLFGVKRRRSS